MREARCFIGEYQLVLKVQFISIHYIPNVVLYLVPGFITPRGNAVAIKQSPSFPHSSQPLGATNLPCVPEYVSVLDMSHKEIDVTCGLLGQAFST